LAADTKYDTRDCVTELLQPQVMMWSLIIGIV